MHPLTEAWVESMREAGFDPCEDAINNYEAHIRRQRKKYGLEPSWDDFKTPDSPARTA